MLTFLVPYLPWIGARLVDLIKFASYLLESFKWVIVKALPILSIPVFFITSVTALLSNDALWSKYTEVSGTIQTSMAGANGGAAVWFARMNYVFPLSESFFILAGMVQLLIVCTVFRMVKAFIPTIS